MQRRNVPWYLDIEAYLYAVAIALLLLPSLHVSAAIAPDYKYWASGNCDSNTFHDSRDIAFAAMLACGVNNKGDAPANTTTGGFQGHGEWFACANPITNCWATNNGKRSGYFQRNGATSCPANSTLSGGTCVCNANYQESGGTCVLQTCQAGADVQVLLATGSTVPDTTCFQGCTTNWSTAIGVKGYGDTWFGSKTGANCSPDTSLTAPNSSTVCPAGQCPGTFNGVTTCLACGAPTTQTTKQTKDTTTNPDGSYSKTTVSTSTQNNITTTTTTTTTYNSSGVATGTTTSTKTDAKAPGDNEVSRFCNENPDSPMCTAYCDKPENAEKLACMTAGTPQDTFTLGTDERTADAIVPVVVGGSGSCPADIPLPKGMSFSWSGTCQVANAIRPVILALAWLSAGLILIGGFRTE